MEGNIEEQGAGAGVVSLDNFNRFSGEKIGRELAVSLIGHLTVVMPVVTFHVLKTVIVLDMSISMLLYLSFYLRHLRTVGEVSVVHHSVVIINSVGPRADMRVKPYEA